NQAGRWNRSIALLGPGGRIRIYDDGFEWVAPDGARVDASRGLGSGATSTRTELTAGSAAPGRAAAVIADALSRFFTSREAAPAPPPTVLPPPRGRPRPRGRAPPPCRGRRRPPQRPHRRSRVPLDHHPHGRHHRLMGGTGFQPVSPPLPLPSILVFHFPRCAL